MTKDDEAAKPVPSMREARLAAALRDNLRRRKKVASPAASAPLARDPERD